MVEIRVAGPEDTKDSLDAMQTLVQLLVDKLLVKASVSLLDPAEQCKLGAE